jgi:hypothetical protein
VVAGYGPGYVLGRITASGNGRGKLYRRTPDGALACRAYGYGADRKIIVFIVVNKAQQNIAGRKFRRQKNNPQGHAKPEFLQNLKKAQFWKIFHIRSLKLYKEGFPLKIPRRGKETRLSLNSRVLKRRFLKQEKFVYKLPGLLPYNEAVCCFFGQLSEGGDTFCATVSILIARRYAMVYPSYGSIYKNYTTICIIIQLAELHQN